MLTKTTHVPCKPGTSTYVRGRGIYSWRQQIGKWGFPNVYLVLIFRAFCTWYAKWYLSGANGEREIFIFLVQLTTSRIGNLARLILLLLYYVKAKTYNTILKSYVYSIVSGSNQKHGQFFAEPISTTHSAEDLGKRDFDRGNARLFEVGLVNTTSVSTKPLLVRRIRHCGHFCVISWSPCHRVSLSTRCPHETYYW